MSTKFRDIFDALWDVLDDDATVAAFLSKHGGHKHKEGANDKLMPEYAKTDLPVLRVKTTGMSNPVYMSGAFTRTMTFDVELHVSQRDIDILFEFAEAVDNAFQTKMKGTAPNLGLAYVHKAMPGDVKFNEHYLDEKDYARGYFRSAALTVTVAYQDTF